MSIGGMQFFAVRVLQGSSRLQTGAAGLLGGSEFQGDDGLLGGSGLQGLGSSGSRNAHQRMRYVINTQALKSSFQKPGGKMTVISDLKSAITGWFCSMYVTLFM